MERVVDPFPVPTEVIRTPVSGPEPANTLAFLRCRASGADISINRTDLVRFEVEFKTKFRIDGFKQAQFDWYVENTKVSATGTIRLANTSTDMEFVMAIDTVEPFIDLDGGLGFTCQLALQMDGLGLFEGAGAIDMVCDVCAYVLLFEPVIETPPAEQMGKPWHAKPPFPELEPGKRDTMRHISPGGPKHALRAESAAEHEASDTGSRDKMQRPC